MARRFVGDGFEGVAEKLGFQSSPDVKFNPVSLLPIDVKTFYSSCYKKSMEIIEMQPNHGYVPSAPPLLVSSLEINNINVAEPSPCLGTHQTTRASNLTAPSDTDVSKPTETSAYSGTTSLDTNEILQSPKLPAVRTNAGVEVTAHPPISKSYASDQCAWGLAVSYEACVRLCLHAWGKCYSTEVYCFLANECALLRHAFGLQNVLLQSEAELLAKGSPKLSNESASPNLGKTNGKIKLEVRKVKLASDEPPASCSISSQKQPKINKCSVCRNVSNLESGVCPWLKSVWKKHIPPRATANASFCRRLDYIQAKAKHIKKVPELLTAARNRLCIISSSSNERYTCFLRLRSSLEEEAVLMKPGSGQAHFFFPDSFGDDIIIAVQDSKGQHCGHARAQVSAVADKPGDKLQWWPIYSDLKLEPIGRVQLGMQYSTNPDQNNHLKFGSISETTAYDHVFEAAVKFQQFQQKNFLIDGPWSWLLTEFVSYFGISEAYSKLRHLSYIMDVATPTKQCLTIVHDMLSNVLMMKGINQLNILENRMLVKIVDQVDQTLALVFENYKSLEEDSPSGIMDVSKPASGLAAPALVPAFQLYSLLHDVSSSKAQMKLCRYFQVAAKKRLRVHFAETVDLILSSNVDPDTAYQSMISLVSSIRKEIVADICIQKQNILPSFVDLSNISSSIYSVELCSRLRAFLVACPPPGLSLPVAQLIIATAEFHQRDPLAIWNMNPVAGGVDAKELFDSHIRWWIHNKRRSLLDRCKLEKETRSDIETQNGTTPFIHDIYKQLMEVLSEYEIISSHLPMYTSSLESAIVDVMKAVAKALEKYYCNDLSPLKVNLRNKVLGNKYVKKLTNQTIETYSVPAEVGTVLNSMKWMLDVMWPKIESKFQYWVPWSTDDGYARGEHLNDANMILRNKYRNYRRAIVDKLANNARVQTATKLKYIMLDSKEVKSEVRSRMKPLENLLRKAIDNLNTVTEPTVCVEVCHELWEKIGQDVMRLLEDKRSTSWCKGLRVAVCILDDIFGSEMQRLLRGKELVRPESIKEVHSILDQGAAI